MIMMKAAAARNNTTADTAIAMIVDRGSAPDSVVCGALVVEAMVVGVIETSSVVDGGQRVQ